MNIDQLKIALTGDAFDDGAVAARLRAKQRVRWRRRLLVGVGSGMACVLGVSIGVVPAFGSSPVKQPSLPPTRATGPVLGLADACGGGSFASRIAYAKSVGASVIIARGRLTGRTTPDHVGGPGTPLSGLLFHEMELDTVKTLSGPSIADGSAAWILNDGVVGDPKAPNVPALGGSAGALWAPDGHLFAIVWPLAATGGTVGPTLSVAPVINDQVVLSDAGCYPMDLIRLAQDALAGSHDTARNGQLLNQLGNLQALRGDLRTAIRSLQDVIPAPAASWRVA